jgi:hypothetical protein
MAHTDPVQKKAISTANRHMNKTALLSQRSLFIMEGPNHLTDFTKTGASICQLECMPLLYTSDEKLILIFTVHENDHNPSKIPLATCALTHETRDDSTHPRQRPL